MTRRTTILATVFVTLLLTSQTTSIFSLRAQVVDGTSSESSSSDSSMSSVASSDESSSTTSLSRLERRALESALSSSEESSVTSTVSSDTLSDSSSVESMTISSNDSSESSSVQSATNTSDDSSDSSVSSDSSASSSDVSSESASSESSDSSPSSESSSSESSESSSENCSLAFEGGSLLDDATLGAPSNVYPSFLIPKTSDFSDIWDVQTRVHITLTDDASIAQPVDETVTEEQAFYRITLAPPATFRPGTYRFQAALNHTRGFSAVLMNTFRKLVGADTESDLMLVDTFFDWGTIAVNTDQSSYTAGSNVLLSAAAVAADGKPLCVDTLIGAFVGGDSKTLSPFCSGSGETLTLRAPSGTSATLVTTANDADTTRVVKEQIAIESAPVVHVKRSSVTRTEAGRKEHMTLRVTTDRTVIGTITERVAPGFEVSGIQPPPTDITHNIDGTFITWDGSFAASATRQFSYDYLTGSTSPLFAFMGPVRFRGQAESYTAPAASESSSSAVSVESSSESSTVSAFSSDDSSVASSIGSSISSSVESSIGSSSIESSVSSSVESAVSSSSIESSLISESSSSSEISFIQGFFQNLLASLTIDETNTISFQEEYRWQLLVTNGDADFSVTERARRLTLERQKAVYAGSESPSFKLVDTILDDTDARLLDANNNLRSNIAYQEILHTVVADEDVTQAIVDHLVAKAQDTTDFGTTTPDAIKEDTQVQQTVAALVTDDAKEKLITSIADQITSDAQSDINEVVDTAATSVVQTQTTALAVAQNAVTQAVTENGTEKTQSPATEETGTSSVLTVSLRGPNGTVIHPKFHFEVGSVELVIDPIQRFVPGLYMVTVTVTNPITGETQTFTQQFAWGVLAMNPDKDVYKEGDIAHIDFGALDDHGEIVCDADLTLTAVAPDGTTSVLSTANHTIIRTDTCGVKEAGIITPDFWGELPLTQSGAYHLTLTGTYHIKEHGVITEKSRSLPSIIVVKNDAPFVISRLGATRLWPFADSPMDIKVTFNTDLNGQIVETIPAGFIVKDTAPNGVVTHDEDGTSHITWEGIWKAGDAPIFHYIYKAPEISPYFFLLGPVKIQSDQPFTGAHLTASGQTIE